MEKAFEFHNQIKAFCRQKELFAPKDRVLLGLSGGADSVCLFLVLEFLAKEWELEIIPVHVNHNLRGEEALRDQRFCEELCKNRQRELIVVSEDVALRAKETGCSLEEAGRDARYEAFAKLQKEYGCNKIAVAHHKEDQAETVLFRLFRGSRLKGLAGMEAKSGNLVRPLLCVTRKDIEEYLNEKEQKFCIDSTNLEEEYTRNYIRHRIVPAAAKVCDRAVEHITETAEYAARVETFLQRLTEELFAECAICDGEGSVSLKIEPLASAESILAERVVYEALCFVYGKKKDITSGAVKDCLDLINKQSGRSIVLKDDVVAARNFDSLYIGKAQPTVTPFREKIEEFPCCVVLPDTGQELVLQLIKREELEENIPKSTYTKWFDYDKIKGVISLRMPEEKDEIVIYTDGRKKGVADIFAEAKVPKEKRRNTLILAEDNRVLWIPGIRGSEAYHVTKETKNVLTATIR